MVKNIKLRVINNKSGFDFASLKLREPFHFNLENTVWSDWKCADQNHLKIMRRFTKCIQKFPKQGLKNWA